MNHKRIIIKSLLVTCPFVLGVIGLVGVEKQPLLDTMYNCFQMYLMDFGGEASNVWIELARWTAPLVTASGILILLTHLGTGIKNGIIYLRGESVAVYAPGNTGDTVLTRLGRRGIRGGERFVKAHSYLLLGDEKENFAFYKDNREKLRGRMVYMRSTSLKGKSAADAGIKLFSPEETAARVFWKQRRLYETSVQKGHRLEIALIGFGRLGEELLYWGLQNLIYSPDQSVTYHIFGDGSHFSAMHPMLGKLSDTVRFYSEPWYACGDLLERADVVAVVEQQDQTKLLADMLGLLRRGEIDVFVQERLSAELLEQQPRLSLFDWQDEAQKPEYIMDEVLLRRAKQINLRYAHLYSGVEETPENMAKEWTGLDGFTRYSNISAADYHDVRLCMLAAMGVAAGDVTKNQELLELLSELEHIRWCRYHYLNNWKYGVPKNGKAKDASRRIHMDLVPYSALTDPEKEKDRENIRVLLSVR